MTGVANKAEENRKSVDKALEGVGSEIRQGEIGGKWKLDEYRTKM